MTRTEQSHGFLVVHGVSIDDLLPPLKWGGRYPDAASVEEGLTRPEELTKSLLGIVADRAKILAGRDPQFSSADCDVVHYYED